MTMFLFPLFIFLLTEGYIGNDYDPPDTLWTKSYGIPGHISINADLDLDWDVGYILAINSYELGSGFNRTLFIRTDANGNKKQMRIISYENNSTEVKAVIQINIDEYVMLCWVANGDTTKPGDAFLVNINHKYEIKWYKIEYQYESDYDIWDLIQTEDKGFLIASYPVCKVDSIGNFCWCLSDIHSKYGNVIRSIRQNRYILSGYDGLMEIFEDGEVCWWNAIHGESICLRDNEGYVVLGSNVSMHDDCGSDYWISFTDKYGDDACGYYSYQYDVGFQDDPGSIIKTLDYGGYAFCGFSHEIKYNNEYLPNNCIIKLLDGGYVQWIGYYPGFNVNSIIQEKDGSFVILGYNSVDAYLIKTESDPLLSIDDNKTKLDPFNLSIIRDPDIAYRISYEVLVSAFTSLTIFNSSGKLIDALDNSYKEPNKYILYWNTSYLAKGIYFLRLSQGNQSLTKKVAIF